MKETNPNDRQPAETKPRMSQFTYGAVYFRKSNPPRSDWERDTAQAAREGMNAFRHWFIWGAIEVKPGVFDWEDYDRHMDLAARHGIRVIIAEITSLVPLWLFRRRPELFARHSRHEVLTTGISGSCAAGNTAWICLDNPEGLEYVNNFLRTLAARYRGHEALLGYDVFNEGFYESYPPFHPDTFRVFRDWLQAKYGSLDAVNEAWQRYSMADWEDVEPPDGTPGPLPESLDLWRFKRERYYQHVQWRVDLIRENDPDHLIVAHGCPGLNGCDDWLFARPVEVYGLTWVASRQGNAPWKQWQAVDWTRAAARGKPFWHAEAQGGPLWLQPQGPGRPREDGRVSTAENVRLWNLVSMAAGARGLFYTRWRGLLDPPLWDAFGLHSLDGSTNPRSEMAAKIAHWANAPAQAELMAAAPQRGELGILHLPESIAYHRMLFKAIPGREVIDQTMLGAYRAFFDMNLQPDWVEIENLDEYAVIYAPHALQMNEQQAARLKAWVADGGVLISEACPGYFDAAGKAGPHQPAFALDKLFGATEASVEFMPDLGDAITFTYAGQATRGGMYRQCYTPAGGAARGVFEDGACAVIEHAFGKGRTLLIGTYPSVGYFRSDGEANQRFYRDLLAWIGIEPRITVTNPAVVARLARGEKSCWLWALNMSPHDQEVSIRISPSQGTFTSAHAHWGAFDGALTDNAFKVTLPGQDGLVLRLEGSLP